MDGDARHGLLSGIDTITEHVRAGVDAVLGSPGWSLSDAEARGAVEALWRARAQVEAAYLHALRVLNDRADALDGAGKGRVAATFLIGRLHVDGSTANADVRTALALDPDAGALSQIGAALSAGEVSREHVDVAVTAIGRLPKAVLRQQIPVTEDVSEPGASGDVEPPDGTAVRGEDISAAGAAMVTGAQFVDGWLAEHARGVQPRTLRAMARGLQDRLDPDHEDRSFDPDAYLKRSVSLHIDPATGLGTMRATLLAADAALMAAFLRSAGKPSAPVEALREEADGSLETVTVRDERAVDMRRYDALFALLRTVFSGGTGTSTAGNRPQSAADEAPASTTLDVDTSRAETPAVRDNAAGTVGAGAGGDSTYDSTSDGRTGDAVAGDSWAGGAAASARLLITATLDQVAAAATLAAGKPVPAAFATAGRAHLDRVGDIDPSLLAYLSCTAAVQRLLLGPSGEPLEVGRLSRLATPAQRRAVAVRDGGCVIPGCPCPAEDVDVHHVIHWAAGGPTDITNLAGTCGRHHIEVHAGIWTLQIRDGIVRVQPPPWIDPQQRWLRAPAAAARAAVRNAAEQLRLHLDDAA